jgi:NAD-dependent deacetylase
MSGASTMEINLEPSVVQSTFSEHRYGLASTEVPAIVADILSILL